MNAKLTTMKYKVLTIILAFLGTLLATGGIYLWQKNKPTDWRNYQFELGILFGVFVITAAYIYFDLIKL